MHTLRRSAVVLIAIVSLLALPVCATSFSTDQSDLWWIPTESGWGMQLVQRGSLIFATMFVYDPSGNAIWYTATLNWIGNFSTNYYAWSGDLYLTNGPWFATVPFNPSAVGYRKVGTMSFLGTAVDTGTLTYSVDGVNVTKDVVRETLVLDNFGGSYVGGVHAVTTSCANPTLNGSTEETGPINVNQNGTGIGVVGVDAITGAGCAYVGTLSQSGQMGQIQGSFTCANGDAGTFQFFEMQVNISGITGRFSLNHSSPPGCQVTGGFGGARSAAF